MFLLSQNFIMKIPWNGFRRNLSQKKLICLLILSVIFFPRESSELINSTPIENMDFLPQENCPLMIPKYFENVHPLGGHNFTLIAYKEKTSETNEKCIQTCCLDSNCSAVFMVMDNSTLKCYHTFCTDDKYCLPTTPTKTEVANKLKTKQTKIVLVRPKKSQSWLNLDPTLDDSNSEIRNDDENIKNVCEVGLDKQECGENEICQPTGSKSRSGTCICNDGFIKDGNNLCIIKDASKVTKVEVQVYSKNITLPQNKVTLSAFVIPEAKPPNSYKYEWNLITGNQMEHGIMENRQNQTLSVSQLEEGIYQFKVKVTGENPAIFGEGLGNITVLPQPRINKPPKAIITPAKQNITLPIKKAVLDASQSTDDTNPEFMSFKWEIISSPIEFKQEIPQMAIITLKDLIPGNYTVKVTVTDKDQASDSALATIMVIPEPDYPPTANAGEDLIIYLPKNKVTLHGNQSSDDHGIVTWEWTRSDISAIAADTKDMRTAHPQISNLEEGVYTFHLLVTDVKGQTGEADVSVYVKPPRNQAPIANAGKNQTINLPKNWVILDGSESKDDQNITFWEWTQLQGPNNADILKSNFTKSNATSLTKGSYLFQLKVKDKEGNEDKSMVTVTVNQDTNLAPKAMAGNDVEVTLPQSVVIVNGSASHDDLRIARWRWTRDPKSLAAGKIVGNSSNTSVLYLVNLVPGVYIFNLKVWDDQGKSSEDAISITVKENPNKKHIIQAVLEYNITSLTQSHVDDFVQSINLLLRRENSHDWQAKVRIINILSQQNTNYAILQFMVDLVDSEGKTTKIMPGIKAVDELKLKLKGGEDILDLKMADLDTLICQNDCSGHGFCQQATRSCLCESFWIENFVRRSLMDGKSNCEWSVIYVGIFISLLLAGSICGIFFLNFKKQKPRNTKSNSRSSSRKNSRYTRLEQNDQNFELRNAHTSSLMISDSDSEDDEEIVFTDDLQIPKTGNGNLSKRNGIAKHEIRA